jgi:hypothetical protein
MPAIITMAGIFFAVRASKRDNLGGGDHYYLATCIISGP